MTFQPRFANLATMLHDVVAKYPERPLFGTRDKEGWQWTTYAGFGRLVAQSISAQLQGPQRQLGQRLHQPAEVPLAGERVGGLSKPLAV